jgi:hypothetical protein
VQASGSDGRLLRCCPSLRDAGQDWSGRCGRELAGGVRVVVLDLIMVVWPYFSSCYALFYLATDEFWSFLSAIFTDRHLTPLDI